MKRARTFEITHRFIALFAVFLIISFIQAAELRTWTDKKGRTLEGKLLKIDGEEAIIRLKTGGEVRLKRSVLSARDNEYLVEYGGAEAVTLTGKVGMPEKSARIDFKTFVKLPDPFIFPDTELMFKVLQTDHFLIMTNGSYRPKNIGETAERLWHGMAFQHPGFQEKWGEQRRAIFILDDDKTKKVVGQWYHSYLQSRERHEAAMRHSATWEKVSGGTIGLSPDITEKYGIFEEARVFMVNKDNKTAFKKVFTPFVTHCLSDDMITTRMGATSSFGTKGRFAITTGHAFYKEIQLAGESGTSLITSDYSDDEIQNASGFQDGTSWAKSLKKLVKKGKITPSIAALYLYENDGLTSHQLVLLYSFSYFMQSDAEHLTAYTKMIARAETSQQIPAPIEVAKFLGFESPEELETAWIEFIKSSAFKD